MSDDLCSLRDMTPADLPYVFSTWSSVAKFEQPWLRALDAEVRLDSRRGYRAYQNATVTRALDGKRGVRAVVACDPEEPAIIYGYAIGDWSASTGALHVAYVRSTFRRRGIASTMLRHLGLSAPVVCAMQPPKWAYSRAIHNPFAVSLAGQDWMAWLVARRVVDGDSHVVAVR